MESYVYEGAPSKLTYEFEFGGGREHKHIIKDLHKKVGKALLNNSKTVFGGVASAKIEPNTHLVGINQPTAEEKNGYDDIMSAIESSDIYDAVE